jgi:two-component system, cell cycle sensor histidine kinase and response regulator CckA
MLYTLGIVGTALVPTWVSENIHRVWGYEPQEALEPDWWFAHVHLDDCAAAVTWIAEPWDHGHIAQEYRFQHRDGSYRWVRGEGEVVQDERGRRAQVERRR